MSEATKDWIDDKFREWRRGKKRGEPASMEAFAAFIGVTRNTLNNWVLRGQTPGDESIDLLGAKLGLEIYELVGKPRPDPLLKLVVARWGFLTDEIREKIAETVARAEARGETRPSDKGVEVPKRRRKT